MSCCFYQHTDICDVIAELPEQYRSSTKFHGIIQSFLDQINCIKDSFTSMCNIESCDDLTGDALTVYGNSVGFGRVHCNASCGQSGVENEFTISDDALYCRLIKLHLISRRGSTIKNLCDATKYLFGEQAFIISSKNGVTKISSGRDLTQEEKNIFPLLKKMLPKSCGTRIEIYDIPDMSSIVGSNCGACNNFADACEENSTTLCGALDCEGF